MSLFNQVNRIENAKRNIYNAIVNKGLSISSSTNYLNTYVNKINSITTYNDIINMSVCVYDNSEKQYILCPNLSAYNKLHGVYRTITKIEIGSKINNMSNTFRYCYNLTGSPACGSNVINMSYAYSGCNNLTGSPACGNNVTDMSYAYCDCYNLTGSPACGSNVINMCYTYGCSYNIHGNGYFYSNKVSNVWGCFDCRDTSKRLNLYIPSTGYNSTHNTLAKCLNTSGSYSIVLNSITWTKSGSYYYNATYNIYIYPVSNVAAARAANGD